MKTEFKKIYSKLSHCSHVPEQYYGHLITLSGMMYDANTDLSIENDLKQLSLAYDEIQNSTLAKVKDIVHEIVFWTKDKRQDRLPDINHLLHQHHDASIDQINALIASIAQLNNQGNVAEDRQERIVADFTPLIMQLGQLMGELKPTKNHDLNLSKIIGWLTQKALELGYFEDEAEFEENGD